MSTGLTSLVTTWICLHPDQLDPGLTAMVITYSLQVTGYLQWLINTFTQLEIEMNSCAVHRLAVKSLFAYCKLFNRLRVLMTFGVAQDRACEALL